jgi:hypothetical protein
VPEGLALHRGREANRRTGGGTTARPGLHGGCRVTGIPTVETPAAQRKDAEKLPTASGHAKLARDIAHLQFRAPAP